MALGAVEGPLGGFLVAPGELGLSLGMLPRFAESELLPEEGRLAAPPPPPPPPAAEPGAMPGKSCDFVLTADPDLATPLRAPLMDPLLVDPFLDALDELESDVAPMELRPVMSALDFRKLSIFSRCKLSSILRFSSCQIKPESVQGMFSQPAHMCKNVHLPESFPVITLPAPLC
jgi:hypothetical protein